MHYKTSNKKLFKFLCIFCLSILPLQIFLHMTSLTTHYNVNYLKNLLTIIRFSSQKPTELDWAVDNIKYPNLLGTNIIKNYKFMQKTSNNFEFNFQVSTTARGSHQKQYLIFLL